MANGLAAVAAIKASVKTSFARRMSGWRIPTSEPSSSSNPGSIIVGTEHDAGKALAAILGKKGFNASKVPREAVPVLDPGQRAVDAGGTNFQGPGAGDRILDIDGRAYVMANLLAVCDADLRPVGAIGHDLHYRSLAPQDGDPDEFKAHQLEARRNDCGQLVLQAGAPQARAGQSR